MEIDAQAEIKDQSPKTKDQQLTTDYCLQRVEHYFVDVTPAPFLARLKRFYDWMSSLVKMLRSMAVR